MQGNRGQMVFYLSGFNRTTLVETMEEIERRCWQREDEKEKKRESRVKCF